MAKKSFEKWASELENKESEITKIMKAEPIQEIKPIPEPEKAPSVIEEAPAEELYQQGIKLPAKYKKIIKELKYVSDKSFKDLCIEAFDYLAKKYEVE